MRLNRFVLITLGVLLSCNETGDSGFAPTGAKGTTNEFGELIYVDEECGGRDDAIYPETFQNALFRDGAVVGDRLWLVDGSHLWAADGVVDGGGAPTPRIVLPFIGHANAVTAGDNFVAVALVDRGVLILPDGNPRESIFLQDTGRAMDVAAHGTLLAVGAGADGVMVYDLANAKNPLPLFSSPVTGYVAGVEWAREAASPMLYYAACSNIGRFDFQNGFQQVGWASTELTHRNAKDIAAQGNYIFVANNGEGLWFYNAELFLRLEQDTGDPNFYANAVAIDAGKTVYLAAGNRELSAYRFGGRPLTSVPKDPIGVLAYNDMVYGFGNFRDVGERTVIRTPTVDSSSIAAFERGIADLTEPYYLQPATALTQAGETVYRISTFVDGADRVYERMLTDTTWRLVSNLRFYGNAGHYAVEVSSDNELRVYAPGQAIPVYTNQDAVGFPDSIGVRFRYRTFETGFIISLVGSSGARQDSLYRPSTYSQDWDVTYPQVYADPNPRTPNALGVAVNYLSYPETESEVVALMEELTAAGQDAHSLIVGARPTENGAVVWVSSQFPLQPRKIETLWNDESTEDDSLYEDSPVGAMISGCDACNKRIQEGGLIDIFPLDEGTILMFDERRAGITALVFLDKTGHEKQRWIHFGRPSGLTQDGATIRAWFADGSSFRFDPAGPLVRLDEFDAVIR